jgi:hypothetical protein
MAERALTTTLQYVLSLSIAAILITSLLFAGTEFVGDRQRSVVDAELRVIGQHVASDIERADRLARAGTGADRLAINSSYPNRIAGQAYRMNVSNSGVRLSTSNPDVTVVINLSVRVSNGVRETIFRGGDVAITYDPGADRLVVTSDG